MMYQYIKLLNANYPVHCILHRKNKSHGLNDADFDIPDNTKLLIVPDAGINDVIECNKLIEQGIAVIILDHHEKNESSIENKAIVVNNQISPQYINKAFSGAGVTYEFLRALDDYYWENYADNFLDLVAFANVSDIMDLRSAATRYYVNKGLENINSPMLKAMITAQDFSMKGVINIHNISWYITPIFNAMIRIGTIEERELLLRAFLGDDELFEYKKRDGTIVLENIYDRVARLCKNAKSRQDKMRDKLFAELTNGVNINDKVIMVQTNNADSGIVGLSCMRLADKFRRPCIVVKAIEQNGKVVLAGSARNFDNSPVEDFKAIVDQTQLFELAAGHSGAFGTRITPENFNKAVATFNDILKDIVYDSSYLCDFILDIEDLSLSFIREVDSAKWIWCTGIKEPKVAIENITIRRSETHIQGKNFNSVAFTVNDIKFVQFNMTDDNPLLQWVSEWDGKETDTITLNVVGEVSINEYQGKLTPQVIIWGVIIQN